VDDALFVRGFERIGNLARDGERLFEREWTASNTLRKILSVDQFHHQRGLTVCSLDAVNLRDVWVVERCEHFGLTLEPREPFSVDRN
jgi:hypothetical protein